MGIKKMNQLGESDLSMGIKKKQHWLLRPNSKSKLELESNLSENERNFAGKFQVYPWFYPSLYWQNANVSTWSWGINAKKKDKQ